MYVCMDSDACAEKDFGDEPCIEIGEEVPGICLVTAHMNAVLEIRLLHTQEIGERIGLRFELLMPKVHAMVQNVLRLLVHRIASFTQCMPTSVADR